MNRTLKSTLLIFFLLITFIPMLFVGYISYQSQKASLTEQLEHNLYILSDNLAIEVSEFINERIADAELVASNAVLKDEDATQAEIRAELQNLLDVHMIYYGAIFLNTQGIVTVDMDGTVIGMNMEERPWFQIAKLGQTYLSDLYLSPAVNRPLLAMAAPVSDENGDIIGVFSPSIDLNYLWRTIDRFSSQRKRAGLSGYAFLINGQGDIVAHPDRTKILKANFLKKNNVSIDTIRKLSNTKELFFNKEAGRMNSFAQINRSPNFNSEWYVGIDVDKDELYAPLRELLIKYILLFGLVLFITTLAVINLSKSILKPVNQLVSATNDFSRGKQVKPLEDDTFEEIHKLNKTFNQMVEKLLEREKGHKKSTLILETIDNGVFAINKQKQIITTFNKTCEELFEIKKEDAVGRNIYDLIEEYESINSFIESSSIIELLSVSDMDNKNEEFEVIINGHKHNFMANISLLPTIDNQNEIEDILIVFSDVTENRFMENELLKSEKLKIAGQLAAGFAHEFRNPLTTIKGFIQLFGEQNRQNETSLKQYYQLVIEEIDRLDSIVTNFLTVAKPNSITNIVGTNINKVIEETIMLYQSQATKKGIEIIANLNELPDIELDAKQLKQVLINLIQNSFDALLNNGGDINISTNYLSNDEEVEIVLHDNGTGMDNETLEQLGNPFFTTKETGTGLGLTTSFKIVKEMNGTLSIDSAIGEGSTFTIKLPYKFKK